MNTCSLCHTSVPSRNTYGADFGSNNHNFAAIEGLDSDGDGFTNIVEINAGTFPGNIASQPAPAPTPARPPVANAGPDQTVNEGLGVTLNGANSTDPDNDIVSYRWQRTAGPAVTISNSTSANASFTAPDVSVGGASLTFSLTVTDSGGRTSTDTCVVNVTWVNAPPVANAGPDQTVDEGVTVTLDGSNSSDVDSGNVTYRWTQTGGPPVTFSNPASSQPTFTSPNVGPDGASLTFLLTVTDSGGSQATDSCVVNVTWVNAPPTANAGPDQTVNEGTLVTLDGAQSVDPDDSIASYLWNQTGGTPVTLSDASAMQPTFTAPGLDVATEPLTFELTVTDHGGLQATDTCAVTVAAETLATASDLQPTAPDLQPTADLCPEQSRYKAYLKKAKKYAKKAEKLMRKGKVQEARKFIDRAEVFETKAAELESYGCVKLDDDDRDHRKDREDHDDEQDHDEHDDD